MSSIEVFISHHTQSCLKITEAICHSLEEKGIRVWYAPRDTQDSYAKNITDVINECKVFVLILNHESSESFDVLNEINYVSERLRKKEPVHVIPFQISNEDISAEAKYYLGRLHWLDAVTPPLEKRIIELTDRICFILNKGKSKEINIEDEENNLLSTNILNNIHFIGRNKELNELEEKNKSNKCVFLHGMGGIGKSEIAKKYANIHKNEYDKIVFAKYETNLEQLIISDSKINITNLFRNHKDGEIETDKQFYKRKLEILQKIAKKEKVLLIIDNFDTDKDENIEEFLQGNYDVIFTTRNDWKDLGYPIIEINVMENEEDLISIFTQNYQVIKYIKAELEEIKNIIKVLDGHTLAIELVAKYMQRGRKSPKEMYQILKQKGITPEITGNVTHQFQNNTIYNYIKTLFDISKINEKETEVLRNLAMFSISEIEFDTFMELCKFEDGFIIDDLIKKNWILHNWETDTISLHPLIKDVIINECKPSLENCKNLFESLTSIDPWKLTQEERLKYEGIILNIYNNYLTVDENNWKGFIEISKFLRDLGYYEQSEKVLFEILKVQERIFTENSEEVAKTYDLLRFVNNKCYKKEKAIQYNEKSIEILRNIKTDGYLLADCLKSRAFSYLKDKEPLKAQELLKEVCEIYNKILPENHYKIGNTNIALSRVYLQLGDYQKSLECAKKAYELLSLKYKQDSLEVATTIKALGQANCKLGNFEEGIKQLKETIRIRKKNLHQDDFSTLDAIDNLADAYIENKQYEDARLCLEEVKKAFDKKLSIEDKWYKKISEKLNFVNEKLA